MDSAENNWFEGSNPFGSSNNQGIEGKNRDIKGSHTFCKRMPLGSFFDVMLRMVHEWSLEDNSLLGSERKSILFTKPDDLKMRSNGTLTTDQTTIVLRSKYKARNFKLYFQMLLQFGQFQVPIQKCRSCLKKS